MADEVSHGELVRRVQELEAETRERRSILYAVQHQVGENEKDITRLQTDAENERKEQRRERVEQERQRKNTNRWVIAAIVIPLGTILLDWFIGLYRAAQGGGP